MKIRKLQERILTSVLVAGALLFALSGCKPSGQKGTDKPTKLPMEKPNIVFILVDDLGFGDLSCYGQKTLSTPHIDKMATEGIKFQNHYTGAPVCAPSRASLLTGKHTGHTNVRGNSPAQLLLDDEITLPKLLKQAGYVTGGIGKWGIGHPPPADDPAKKGFDYFYGYINMWHAHNFYPEFMYRNGEKVMLKNKTKLENGKNPWAHMPEGTGVAEVKEEYAHDLFDTEALNFIETNKDTNFFLYLALNVPHANNEGIPDGMEVDDYYEFADKEWPSQEKGFAAMMRNIDNSVDMINKKLQELGIADETMVVFCSDNGPHQEGGHVMEFFNSNGDLHGMKRDLYDGGVRTPLIIKWPGVIAPNTSSNHLCAFWDWVPTFCDITGIATPSDVDGVSMLPSMLGDTSSQKKHDYLYWEFYELDGRQSVIADGYKAIKYDIQKDSSYFELYHLSEDPFEKQNIAENHPEIIEKMQKIMDEAHGEFDKADLFTPNSQYNAPF
ncbi:MAG: arylsulfatase [Bacteroidales bacterium]|nr:arylsulfatase [Bacteroidales bacterium]